MDVSIIIPIYNGSTWIKSCFEAILAQTALKETKLEVCICNDSSDDDTQELLDKWKSLFEDNNITFKCYLNDTGSPKGVGYAKNKAVELSTGQYLCFQDVDDVMLPERILMQFKEAKALSNDYLIGSKFVREPRDSTIRYTNWANNLSNEQLVNQIYTSNGPTIIMPTWFCHRSAYDRVGGFVEDGKGTPEDLIFFYKHLDLDGKVYKVETNLLVYYYHQHATTFSIKEETIWNLRLERLQSKVLCNWKTFTIWNAGKQGRKFYNSLSAENRVKVMAMCDVDVKKVNKKYTPYDARLRKAGKPLDMVHFKDAKPPFVICVKLDMTGGCFEKNLESLQLKENLDYVYFS